MGGLEIFKNLRILILINAGLTQIKVFSNKSNFQGARRNAKIRGIVAK
jgi:hypothetical protein